MKDFYQKLMQVVGQAIGHLKPWCLAAGVVLTAALGIDTFVTPVPGVELGTPQMALAALLVFAGR